MQWLGAGLILLAMLAGELLPRLLTGSSERVLKLEPSSEAAD